MAEFFKCNECGETFHSHSNHERTCEGSPESRITVLEDRIGAYEAELRELRCRVERLEALVLK
jgi:transcription initiation factor IIE alpha subunit